MNECSLKTWQDIQPLTGKIINQVLAAFTIKSRATREDIEDITGLKTQTVTARLNELRCKYNLITICGKTKTRAGYPCSIYKLIEDQGYGRAVIVDEDPSRDLLTLR